MRPLVVALILLLILLPGASHARGYEVKKKVENYEIEIRIDKNPIVLGDNRIEIEIKSEGKIVRDLKVLVNYYMRWGEQKAVSKKELKNTGFSQFKLGLSLIDQGKTVTGKLRH